MKFFVKILLRRSITGREAREVRPALGKHIQKVTSSTKFVEGGVFGGTRGGYFVLDVASTYELTDLLAPTILDNFDVECYPLMGFEELGRIFQRLATEKE